MTDLAGSTFVTGANARLEPMLGALEHDDEIDPKPTCVRLEIGVMSLDEALRRAFTDEGSTP